MSDIKKITVIGFTGSGKTAYLAGMYDLMSRGLDGFGLNALDSRHDIQLEDIWEGIIKDPSNRVWPAGNNITEKYQFNLSYAFDTIAEFEWMDYPGVFVRGRDEGYAELKQQLFESTCILLFVSGKSFAVDGNDKDTFRKKAIQNLRKNNDTDSIIRLSEIARDLAQDGKKLPPCAIVLTKCDLIPEQYISSRYGESIITDIIRTEFNQLFANNDDKNGRPVSIIPVTLGEIGELGNIGNIDPYNLELPIAFAVLNIITEYAVFAKALKNNAESEIERFRGKLFPNKKKIIELQELLSNIEEIIRKTEKDVTRLLNRFDSDFKIYVNGGPLGFMDYFKKLLK